MVARKGDLDVSFCELQPLRQCLYIVTLVIQPITALMIHQQKVARARFYFANARSYLAKETFHQLASILSPVFLCMEFFIYLRHPTYEKYCLAVIYDWTYFFQSYLCLIV